MYAQIGKEEDVVAYLKGVPYGRLPSCGRVGMEAHSFAIGSGQEGVHQDEARRTAKLQGLQNYKLLEYCHQWHLPE